MSHPIQTLGLSSGTSPESFHSERVSYCFVGLWVCSGLNMVWMTNMALFLTRSTQHGSSRVMVMISFMNPSIEASFDSIFTSS